MKDTCDTREEVEVAFFVPQTIAKGRTREGNTKFLTVNPGDGTCAIKVIQFPERPIPAFTENNGMTKLEAIDLFLSL